MNERQGLSDELFALLAGVADGTLSDEEQQSLAAHLRTSEKAREAYADFMMLQVQLELEFTPAVRVQPLGCAEEKQAEAWTPTPVSHFSPARLRLLALAAALLVAVGIAAYALWPRPAAQPVVKNAVGEPAAKVASTMDAQWLGPLRPKNGAIAAGERLVLERGLVEITFSRQARMFIEAPTDVVIVDGGACRLASGKLTAYVPVPAKGFQVYTPEGTVTDRGTEFGVYVKSEVSSEKSEVEEQREGGQPLEAVKLPPITEVHVFKGQVDITTAQVSTTPESKIQNPKSKIVSAGQAVTISDNKVQPLPAADPFKFALDKLSGKQRQVLLSEDFESYDVGSNVQAIGPWTVQSGTRKGQGIRIFDAPHMLSEYKTDAGDPYPNLTPSPPTGGRFVFIACASPNRPETYPILAREIDGKLLTRNGQVLIEFDMLQNSTGPFEPSLALASKVEHTAGIELGRDAEGKKIEWLPYQCYRLRLLLDVTDGTVRGVRSDRLHWRGPQGWVRDLTFVPAAKFDWSTPPRYAIFGFPVVSGTTPGSLFWLDNIRIEVISEK